VRFHLNDQNISFMKNSIHIISYKTLCNLLAK